MNPEQEEGTVEEKREGVDEKLAALAELGAMDEEQRAEARRGAVDVVERYMAAWAEEDWASVVEETQRTWHEEWAKKVQDDTPQPDDPRLLGEGANGEGPSWKEATGGSVESLLEQLVGQEKVVLYEVQEEDAEVRGPVLVDVPVEAVVRDRLGSRRRVLMQARVVREEGAYEPSEDGTWGVNPTSLRRRRAGG